MTSIARDQNAEPGKSVVHRIALAAVWVAVASGAIVFSEPAPVDVLTLALIVGLPAVGLVALPRAILLMFCFWIVAAAASIVASTQAHAIDVSLKHSLISLYLVFAAVIFSGFVALKPSEHTDLILRAYTFGALCAAVAGLVGYFGLLPGADDLFTKYGRAAGPFKDPNVFGPFLIPAALYTFHRMFNNGKLSALSIITLSLLGLALLVSFSRGAWINAIVAGAIYGLMTFIVSQTNRDRLNLIVVLLGGCIALALLTITALQFDKVAKLMNERATFTQSYDVGPDGRFGGQRKAIGLIVDHPLGIGALEFSGRYHTEEVHNVYLSMLLNSGWVGGLAFLGLMVLTCVFGLRRAFLRGPTQPLLIVAVAAFSGNVVEGAIVDIDHWRHLYLLMAIVWGLAAVAPCGIPRCRRAGRIVRAMTLPVLPHANQFPRPRRIRLSPGL